MKNLVFILWLLVTSTPFFAQNVGVSLQFGVRKTFHLNKKSTLDLREQLQFTPEFKKKDPFYGDFFNETGFWPVPDHYDDDSSDDDDDDDDAPSSGGNPPSPAASGGLDDTPVDISIDWRSATALQYNYRFYQWLRANTGYSLFYNGTEFRHTFRGEIDYRPMRHGIQKRKLDLAARSLFQYIGRPGSGSVDWNAMLVPRIDVEYAIKKNHILGVTNALNGHWSEGVFRFDRWRINTSLVFVYSKIHRFTLGYQFQVRLDQKSLSQGLSFGYEIRW